MSTSTPSVLDIWLYEIEQLANEPLPEHDAARWARIQELTLYAMDLTHFLGRGTP